MNNKKIRILVVDDEESVTRMLKLNLEQTGDYEVRTVNLPKEVIHAAREFHPDLFLLDVLMPDLTGDYLAQELRDIPEWKHVPIVFLTAIGEDSSESIPIDKPPVVCKPVEMSRLIAVLNEVLAKSRSSAAGTPPPDLSGLVSPGAGGKQNLHPVRNG